MRRSHRSNILRHLKFTNLNLEQEYEFLLESIKSNQSFNIRFINSWSVVKATETPKYQKLLESKGINIVDSKIISTYLRRSNIDENAKLIRGTDYFRKVMDKGREAGLQHFLIGGTEDSIQILSRRLKEEFPGLSLVGCSTNQFSINDYPSPKLLEQIKESGAHIVWLGIGSPKQDLVGAKITDALGVITVGVGAAFDFIAGVRKEAPRMFQKLGLEWLFRWAQEPKRLFYRYFVGNLKFIRIIVSK